MHSAAVMAIKQMNNLQSVSCNLCGKLENRLITMQNDYRVVKCVNCGLVYTNPRPDRETLKKMYEGYHQRGGSDENAWADLMAMNFKSVSLLLRSMFPGCGNVLDIGCGYGHFIEIMKNSGWTELGIDPSSRTIDHARKKGLNVIETTFDETSFPDCSFNVVTMFYVLEHLLNPVSSLKQAFRILKPRGVIVIRVPHTTPIVSFLSFFNIKNNLYDPPFHLYDFSPDTVKQLLSISGFWLSKIMPGEPTLPPSFLRRALSVSFTYIAKLMYHISAGIFLLPGVSKTIVAVKPGGSSFRT